MPYRFFRRVRIAPGVRINFSKSSPSISVGVRGAHYTFGHGRHRTTVGVPGTGLFYTSYSHRHARAASRDRSGRRVRVRTQPRGTPSQSSAATIAELFAKPPGAKIGWGILLIVFVITSPVGVVLLATGTVQLFSKRWRARGFVARAAKAPTPEAAGQLLDQAVARKPDDPEVIAALATWHANQHSYEDAVQLYARYLASAPDDAAARGQYARCLLLSGQPDAAIAQFLELRTHPLDDESQATITTFLALAQLVKGDARQALAILKEAPLQRHTLGAGLQQCLQYRAIAQYFAGSTSRAIGDLDRLYAVNPAYPDVAADKAAMRAGTFQLETPAGPITRDSFKRQVQAGPVPPAL